MSSLKAGMDLVAAARGVVFLFWDGGDGDNQEDLSCRGCGKHPLHEHGPHCNVKALSEAIRKFEESLK